MKRLLKWTAVFVLVAQWYARGGREFLFGEHEQQIGVGEVLRTWIDLPPGWTPGAGSFDFAEIRNTDGIVGYVTGLRKKRDARDPAGYPTEQFEAQVEIDRRRLGQPINVAFAEAQMLTYDALGIG